MRATASRGGTTVELLVSEGEEIEIGKSLAKLRLSASSPEGDVGAAIEATLDAQSAASDARAKATLQRLEKDELRLLTQRRGVQSELAQLSARIELHTTRTELMRADADRAVRAAEEGLLPQVEADARVIAHLDSQIALATLKQSAALLEGRIADFSSQLDAIPIETELALADAEAAAAALEERTTQTIVTNEYIVTSPISGRVDAITVRLGQSLRPGDAIAAISPINDELIAELYVPSRAAGFIQPEQEVRLKYQAFPFQRFGIGEAQVTSVSQTVLSPSEVPIPGVQLQEPVFRVSARLERESVEAYGEEIPLRSGMLLSADIIFDRRTLLEWLLDPLYATGRS
ncbi:MAG: HlyD family efflux transporter periplasmic adaptor subunit [Pseudomonadota bacterium]